jgi:hypothetical protein
MSLSPICKNETCLHHRGGAELAQWRVKMRRSFFDTSQLSLYLRCTRFCDKSEMCVPIARL